MAADVNARGKIAQFHRSSRREIRSPRLSSGIGTAARKRRWRWRAEGKEGEAIVLQGVRGN